MTSLKFFLFPWLLSVSLFASDSLTFDLKNPVYAEGVLSTEEGGVFEGPDLRIQASRIKIIKNNNQIARVEADGNLLMQYKGRAYVGRHLDYDCLNQTGVLHDGKCGIAPWYLGGQEIRWDKEGKISVDNAFLTSDEEKKPAWGVEANQMHLSKNGDLSLEGARMRLSSQWSLPAPSITTQLQKDGLDLRYAIDWDLTQGPRASARVPIYEGEKGSLYSRIIYRMPREQLGHAVETKWSTSAFQFTTSNYLDDAWNFRFQGSGQLNNATKTESLTFSWDKGNRGGLATDHPASRTQVLGRVQTENAIMGCYARLRLNAFESGQQKLPELFFAARPHSFGSTGCFWEVRGKAAVLDTQGNEDRLLRVELRPSLVSPPMRLGPLVASSYTEGLGISYGSTQSLSWLSGAKIRVRGEGIWDSGLRHQFQPYVSYTNIRNLASANHPILSAEDGWRSCQEVRAGFEQHWITSESHWISQCFTQLMWNKNSPLMKFHGELIYQLPHLELSLAQVWTQPSAKLEQSKLRLLWTRDENCALGMDLRYRSTYSLRKSNREQPVLESTYKLEELLSSPLSNERLTLSSHIFLRLNPFWECEVRSHHGWAQTLDHQWQVDISTWLAGNWKLRSSYKYANGEHRVNAGLSLIKK